MPNRPTYSLQILLGTVAAFAVAVGAFAAPESLISGLLVLILAMCGPGLLIIVWRSGGGYRRSFVLGAAAPCVVCACRTLKELGSATFNFAPPVTQIVEYAGLYQRTLVLTFMAIALGGGLAGIGVQWLLSPREDNSQDDAF